jgi:RHS repeat-associated protein
LHLQKATSDVAVYDDQLHAGWYDWSWNVERDFASTEEVVDGKYVLRLDYTANWGAFHPQYSTDLEVGENDTLSLSILSPQTQSAWDVHVQLTDQNDADLGYHQIAHYIDGDTLEAGVWYDLGIPLSALNPADAQIGGITLQVSQPMTLHLDNVAFTGASAPEVPSEPEDPAHEAVTYVTQYVYNDHGALVQTVYPDSSHVAQTYNALGQVKTLGKDGSAVISSITYDIAGGKKEVAYANGTSESYTYDPNKQYLLTGKTAQNGVETLQNIVYTYDPVGNITQITDTGSALPKSTTYQYDDLSRLTRADITVDGSTETETFMYSPTGNILSKNAVAYTYGNDQHPQAVTAVGTDAYSYDANGNLVSAPNATYEYDGFNRLSYATNAGEITHYIYGADTQRIQKRNADGGRLTYIGAQAEADETGVFTNYVFAGGSRVATQNESGTIYNIQDHLSSASLSLDESGNVVQKLDYYPFGSERVNEKTGDFDTHFTYTDQEKDKETGLMYYGARYYDAEVGRFTQVDPWFGELSIPQTLNKYTYTLNNPLVYVDPTGEKVELVSRGLNKTGGSVGVHTFLRITPDNPEDFGEEDGYSYTLGGYSGKTGKLEKGRNRNGDFNISDDKIKTTQVINTPEGMTDTEYIKKINAVHDGYNNTEDYNLLSINKYGYNCNNYSSSLIIVSGGSIPEGYDPSGFNPGLGEVIPSMRLQQSSKTPAQSISFDQYYSRIFKTWSKVGLPNKEMLESRKNNKLFQ